MHENLPATYPCRVFRLLKFDCSLSKYHGHSDMRSAMAQHCLSMKKAHLYSGNTRGLNRLPAWAGTPKIQASRTSGKIRVFGISGICKQSFVNRFSTNKIFRLWNFNILSVYLKNQLADILSGSWPFSVREIYPSDPDPSPRDSVGQIFYILFGLGPGFSSSGGIENSKKHFFL